MAKLDKSKKFGTIGGTHGNARYEQCGVLFDGDGNELNADGFPLKAKGVKAESPEQAPAAPAQTTGEGGNPAPTGAPAKEVTKEELLAQAKALGIAATKNWGIQKLQEEIAAVEAVNEDQVSKSLAG